MDNSKKNGFDRYSIRVEDGIHFLYFDGLKLPAQRKSIITQDSQDATVSDPPICEATIN